MYRLMKLVGDEWYLWGTYATPSQLAQAAHFLGTAGVCQIKVEVVEK